MTPENTETPTLTVVEDEGPDLLGETKEKEPSFDDQLPAGISWPDSLDTIMSAEEVKELYTQIANKAITDWVGTPYYILLQFEHPQSVAFGLRTSEKRPSSEALLSVLRKITNELETLDSVATFMQTPVGQAFAEFIEKSNVEEGTIVDQTGLPVLNLNRDQKRHPEKYGLKRK